MDKPMLERHLVMAWRHVAEGERTLSRQCEMIARLDQGGYDTTEALSLLGRFKESQALHVAHRDWLLRELSV